MLSLSRGQANFRGLEAKAKDLTFEAKAKDFKMCPRGLHLWLLASGSFQSSAKDNINVAQSTVSCTLSRFMDSLLSKKKEYIYMPDSVYAEEIKLQFYLLGRFPSVIGAID